MQTAVETYALDSAVSSPQKISLMQVSRSKRNGNEQMMSPVLNKEPRLERQTESMPRLEGTGRSSQIVSRRSGIGHLNMNQSMEVLQPLGKESSMMKIAGNSIIGSGLAHSKRFSAHTIDYNILNRDDSRMSQTQKNDPYKSISV